MRLIEQPQLWPTGDEQGDPHAATLSSRELPYRRGHAAARQSNPIEGRESPAWVKSRGCLLYTSDAADE